MESKVWRLHKNLKNFISPTRSWDILDRTQTGLTGLGHHWPL